MRYDDDDDDDASAPLYGRRAPMCRTGLLLLKSSKPYEFLLALQLNFPVQKSSSMSPRKHNVRIT